MVFEFRIPEALWMTSNMRLHPLDKAARTKAIRGIGRYSVPRNVEPFDRPVRLTAEICLPIRRRFDAPNAWPVVKALVDGMVDAGLLVDDSSGFVCEHSFREGAPVGRGQQYLVRIYPSDC